MGTAGPSREQVLIVTWFGLRERLYPQSTSSHLMSLMFFLQDFACPVVFCFVFSLVCSISFHLHDVTEVQGSPGLLNTSQTEEAARTCGKMPSQRLPSQPCLWRRTRLTPAPRSHCTESRCQWSGNRQSILRTDIDKYMEDPEDPGSTQPIHRVQPDDGTVAT